MKTDSERKEIIDAINVMLNQAYDSTLDEVFTLLKKIEDEEDESDIKAYDEGQKDIKKMVLYLGKKLSKRCKI